MAMARAAEASAGASLCSRPPLVSSPSSSSATATATTSHRRKARRSAVLAFAAPPSPGGESRRPLIQPEEPVAPTSGTGSNGFLPPQEEDVDYLWKLAAGSVGAGAVVKYGSVLFPETTRPSILQALLMIGIPVALSVFLLMKASNSKGSI